MQWQLILIILRLHPYLPQAVFMLNKLKLKQLNKPQRLQQRLSSSNNNITSNYKDNAKWKLNNACNKKHSGFKSLVKSFPIYKIIILVLGIPGH